MMATTFMEDRGPHHTRSLVYLGKVYHIPEIVSLLHPLLWFINPRHLVDAVTGNSHGFYSFSLKSCILVGVIPLDSFHLHLEEFSILKKKIFRIAVTSPMTTGIYDISHFAFVAYIYISDNLIFLVFEKRIFTRSSLSC